MKPYQFKKVFVRYAILLSSLLIFIYSAIILLFNWQVNEEMREVASRESTSIQEALNAHQQINVGHPYFIVDHKHIVENETRFNDSTLIQAVVSKHQSSMRWSTQGMHFQVEKQALKDQRTLYSLIDMSDFEETKNLLFNVLMILMVLTFILSIGTAYYIAVKPVRVYERMLEQHKEFIQDASHELKTPIAAISLGVEYIKALDGAHLTEQSKSTLNKIKHEIQYVEALISKTLKTSGQTQVEMIDVASLLDDVIDQQQQLHEVDIDREYSRPLNYQVSPVNVKQMVTILIDNAIKHNHQEIQIGVSAQLTEKGLTIEVSDNGQGIDAQHIERIFERYYQTDASVAGSGLGLSLLKNLVQEAGGSIEVKSQKNIETRFILTI